MKYANGTSVPIERSKAEIERLVQKYGATQFFSGWDSGCAIIGFRMKDRFVRFKLPLPDGKKTYMSQERLQAETRRLWRVLGLVLKAKFEAVQSRVSEFETEFLGNIVVSNGQTVGEWATPQLNEMYSTGRMPQSLLLGSGS